MLAQVVLMAGCLIAASSGGLIASGINDDVAYLAQMYANEKGEEEAAQPKTVEDAAYLAAMYAAQKREDEAKEAMYAQQRSDEAKTAEDAAYAARMLAREEEAAKAAMYAGQQRTGDEDSNEYVIKVESRENTHVQMGQPGKSVSGFYMFYDPEGRSHRVAYVADEKGYRVLPEAPAPTPVVNDDAVVIKTAAVPATAPAAVPAEPSKPVADPVKPVEVAKEQAVDTQAKSRVGAVSFVPGNHVKSFGLPAIRGPGFFYYHSQPALPYQFRSSFGYPAPFPYGYGYSYGFPYGRVRSARKAQVWG